MAAEEFEKNLKRIRDFEQKLAEYEAQVRAKDKQLESLKTEIGQVKTNEQVRNDELQKEIA